MKPIYVKFKRPRSVREFLIQLYSRDSNSPLPSCVTTYHNKECTNVQCSKNWRSYDDIYALIHTYYPSITHKQLIHNLLVFSWEKTIYKGGKEEKTIHMFPHFGYCGGMSRLRWMPFNYASIYYFCTTKTYSWQELFAKLNVDSMESAQIYIDNHSKTK